MGQRLSRSYYTPLRDVTVRQLAGCSSSNGAAAAAGEKSAFLLSPSFCLRVLKRALPPHYECSRRELAKLGEAISYGDSAVSRERQRKVEEQLWVAMTRRKPTR